MQFRSLATGHLTSSYLTLQGCSVFRRTRKSQGRCMTCEGELRGDKMAGKALSMNPHVVRIRPDNLPDKHLQAAAQGDLQALQAAWQQAGHSWHALAWGKYVWFLNSGNRTWAQTLSAAAAAGGHLVLLQWLQQNGCSWDQGTCSCAARGGHLAVLQWARLNGCSWDGWTCAQAAKGGHLAVLQWACQSGCRWDGNTCYSAAEGDHLAALEWARQNGCSWDESTCSGAASGGYLAVLQGARHNCCSWDENTCANAADEGHLAVLQWTHENNCPWCVSTTLQAACKSHLDILKWAWQQQPPCPWWSLEELDDDEEYDLTDAKPSTLLWLAQQGTPLPEEAHAIACSSADRLTHAYIALRALLPADVLDHILKLSLE